MKTLSRFGKKLLMTLFLWLYVSMILAQTYNYCNSNWNTYFIPVDTTKSSKSPDSLICVMPIVTNAERNNRIKDISTQNISGDDTHSHIPTSISIDKKCIVGEIPFNSGLSSSGAMTYNVPIEVPKGRNGLQPNLSLNYSSQGANDVAGYGWTIGGLSTIIAVPKNIYFNGKVSPVGLNEDDAFVLDGVRLIKKDDGTFDTAQGNMRIYAVQANNKIRYFTVAYPNGMIAHFGIVSATPGQIIYPITHVSDAFGNEIDYTYIMENGRCYIEKIAYGSHFSGINPHFAEVKFTYKSRLDSSDRYEKGTLIGLDRLLDKVECYNDQEIVHTYSFTYQTDRVSLLTGINCDNLNPLQFFYGYGDNVEGELSEQKTTLTTSFEAGLSLTVSKGKISYGTDNDGLIIYPDRNPCSVYYQPSDLFHHSVYYYYSGYNSAQKLLIYQNLGNPSILTPTELTAENGFQTLFSADIDGEPGEEIVKINNWLEGSDDRVSIKTYKPDSYYNVSLKSTLTLNSQSVTHFDNKSFWPKLYFPGDYNGDGKVEVLAVSICNPLDKNLESKCFLFDLSNTKVLFNDHVFNFNAVKSLLIPIDVDGDGKTDICHIQEGGTDVYSFENSNNSYSLSKKYTFANVTKTLLQTGKVLFGDMNGDGKIDILHSPAQCYYTTSKISFPLVGWKHCPRCGDGYVTEEICPKCKQHIGKSESCFICSALLNSDGACPRHGTYVLVDKTEYHDKGDIWTVYLSTGDGFVEKKQSLSNVLEGDSFMLQDADFDGIVDLIRCRDGIVSVYPIQNGVINEIPLSSKYFGGGKGSRFLPSSITLPNYYNFMLLLEGYQISKISFSRNETKQRLLTGMVNSLGVVQRNYYQRLNDDAPIEAGPRFYFKGSGAVFPYENYQGPLWASLKQETYLNDKQLSLTAFRYMNAVLHRQGLGFCGFERIITTDMLRRQHQAKTFNPMKFGVLLEEVSSVSRTNYSYQINVSENRKMSINLSTVITKDSLKETTVEKRYNYDYYNNPIYELTEYKDNETTNEIKEIVTQSYVNSVEMDFLIGLPAKKEITNWRDGQKWVQSEETTYIEGTALPRNRVSKINGEKVGEIQWAYDDYGNLLSEKSAPYNATEFLGTTYTYDNRHRYLVSQTDALGRTTTYSLYNKFGSPTAVTDFLGNVSTYTFDNFGRTLLVKNPDGTNESTSYVWSPRGGVYFIQQNTAKNQLSKTYYDALNREVSILQRGANKGTRTIDKHYDDYGRLSKVSLPYTSNTPLWNTYEYDQYDRLTDFKEASGKSTFHVYSRNKVRTVENGIMTTNMYDKSGQLKKISDQAGGVAYEYRPDGQPKNIIAPDGIVTSFEYDNLGRQTKINDPSAGTQTYTENYSGNIRISTRTNARGQVIKTKFDKYGRLIRKDQPEFSTEYQYNAVNHQLERVVSSNRTSHTYTYDSLGRLTSEEEFAPDDVWLRRDYAYNSGAVSKIKYTSSVDGVIAEENFTYDVGQLVEVRLDTASIWKLQEENSLGQPVEVLTGPVSRSYRYNDYGSPTERMAGNFQHFAYSFDVRTGNLLSRTDVKRNLVENFEYDGLNRLTAYGDQTVSYDKKGNIINRSEIGDFSYNLPNKPYALTNIGNNGNLFQNSNQTISYTSFERPNELTDGSSQFKFYYNASGERVKMQKYENVANYYLGNCYETDKYQSKLYLAGDYYSSPAVLLKSGDGKWKLYYLCRDYLGSITHEVFSNGELFHELSYDAWGRLRNPETHQVLAYNNGPKPLTMRGYCGHELLAPLGLLNMNARLYDLATGRFLSPDPYVQMPYNSQNFNRYSYCLNNPLVYVDENGEFIFSYVFGFLKGVFKWENPFKSGWQAVKNEAEIIGGLFYADNAKQFFSRFTWELPQTLLGYGFSQVKNYVGKVDKVEYFDGATYVIDENSKKRNGMTLSNFININDWGKMPVDHSGSFSPLEDGLYMHEYAHYLQSQEYGWGYLFNVGIPSIFSAKNSKTIRNELTTHKIQWYERGANKKASEYFKEKYGVSWNSKKYPLEKPNFKY